MNSKKIPSQWSEWLQQILTERFQTACEVREHSVSDPFREVRQATTFPPDAVFVVWADKETRAEDFLIRIFDIESRLQWTMTKIKIEGLSETSAKAVLGDAISRLLNLYPFQGVLKENRVMTWSNAESAKFVVAERIGIDRHPLLPQILKFNYKVKPEAEIFLDRSPEGQSTLRGEGKKIKSLISGERPLWLVVQAR